MGDIFHQTDSSQRATNQQVGISTRDTGGSVITLGAGAQAQIESLDPAALNVAAIAVHDALASNTQTSLAAFQSYQRALEIAGESTGEATDLAKQALAAGTGTTPPQVVETGIDPKWVIGGTVAIALIAAALFYFRKR